MKDFHKNSVKFTIFLLDAFRKYCYFLSLLREVQKRALFPKEKTIKFISLS